MYCKYSNVQLHFQDWSSPFSPLPRAFSQQPTLSSPEKLPAVTQVLFFQTACKMTSHRCIVVRLVSEKTHMYTTEQMAANTTWGWFIKSWFFALQHLPNFLWNADWKSIQRYPRNLLFTDAQLSGPQLSCFKKLEKSLANCFSWAIGQTLCMKNWPLNEVVSQSGC